MEQEIDLNELDRLLDKTKGSVFIGRTAAFLGSLLCDITFIWDSEAARGTAATDGVHIWWCPKFFMGLPPKTRETILMHELWHPGLLHMIRRGNRDPKVWNYACMPGDSLIAMADGSCKPIAEVNPGDQIKNVKDGTSSVAIRINSGIKDILEFTYESGRILKCTPDHKVLTEDGFQNAAQLTAGSACFVDTRFDQNPKRALGEQTNARDCRPTRHEIPPSGGKSLHSRLDQISEAIIGNVTNADLESTGMGLSCRFDRWRRNNHHHPKDGEGQTISSTKNACDKHLPSDAGLVSAAGIRLNTPGEQQRLLVLHHAYSADSLEGITGEVASLVSHQAALSNVRTSLDGSTESASLQVYLDARNGKNSRGHLYLEHDRIVQIRQLPAEETFDLVTSDHHFIANGVVVHNCDIRINNDLKNEGYSFEGIEWGWLLPEVDALGRMAEEDIYDYIIKNNIATPELPHGSEGDMCEPSEDTKRRVVASVVKATHNAKSANKQNTVPGILDDVITKFLTPVVPWEALLKEFFLDLGDWSYTWSRPNRRHTTMYLPSRVEDEEGRLDHLMYFLDVSGSISQMDELRFSSEVRYIKQEFNPRKLTLVQFDTRIHEERVFLEDDPFEELVIMGRGGTCLRCVHDLIEKHNPTAAIIFSDMHVAPMPPLSTGTPIIYVAVGNGGHTPTFGKVIRIKR